MNGKKPKPYMDNDWRLIKNSPDELFYCPTFEEFMEHRVHSWEIKHQYVAINRIYDSKTGKVTEKAYKQAHAAQQFLAKSLTKTDNEIALATHSDLYFFSQDGTDVS